MPTTSKRIKSKKHKRRGIERRHAGSRRDMQSTVFSVMQQNGYTRPEQLAERLGVSMRSVRRLLSLSERQLRRITVYNRTLQAIAKQVLVDQTLNPPTDSSTLEQFLKAARNAGLMPPAEEPRSRVRASQRPPANRVATN